MMQLIHGDCLEKMKDIPDKSIDMILCDLPYGTTACKWDVVIPFNKHIKEINNRGKEIILYRDEYILQEVKKGKSYKDTIDYFDNNAIDGLWDNYNRIIKDNGIIALFGSEPFSTTLRMSNFKLYRYDWYWEKTKAGLYQHSKNRPMKAIETISIFSKAKWGHKSQVKNRMPYNPQGIRSIGEKTVTKNFNAGGTVGERPNQVGKKYEAFTGFPNDVLKFANIIGKQAIHSTQKPVPLCEYLIKTYTLEGETVLDNCAGSGSTGVACLNTNRNFIGIEKDDKYFEIAKKRIEKAKSIFNLEGK